MLINASLLYYELINMYKKEYEQVFESKDENWEKKRDYKNLEEFNYQVNKVDVTKKEEKNEDKTDQKLPSWIKLSKSRFIEINDEITKNYKSKLMSKAENKYITLNNAKELVEGIINKKNDRQEAKKMYNNIVDDANELGKLRLTNSRRKMLSVFLQLQEIFRGSKTEEDETKDEDDEDNEDDEEIDTTAMPDLESEESAEQRRKQEAKGLKILTPNQMLTRFPIYLAQLEAGNNSEKLKNEIRQLLHSLYSSNKLPKTAYKYLMNTN